MPNLNFISILIFICREKISIGGGAKQWIYWDPSFTRERQKPTSPWFNFTDKYHPIFDFMDDTQSASIIDFWISVAECMETRDLTLRLNHADGDDPSCLEESLNQYNNVSSELSSSRCHLLTFQYIGLQSLSILFQYWRTSVILTYSFWESLWGA